MKSKRFLLLGLLASSLCLAGCGNDDNKGKEDGEKIHQQHYLKH